MIKEAGLGVVVNNAMDDVKQIANYICNKKLDEGGVKEALEKFILN
jgi:hydroxymethylpyrimidine pyrophosphatase-like HAD family hydrolase